MDASCLAYSSKGECLATVDYDCTSAFDLSRQGHRGGFQEPAIRHSGDEIDGDRGTGEHTIDVELSALPSDVRALYFVVSAFTTTLSEALQVQITQRIVFPCFSRSKGIETDFLANPSRPSSSLEVKLP